MSTYDDIIADELKKKLEQLEQQFVEQAAQSIAEAGARGWQIHIWPDGSVTVDRLPEIYQVK